MCSVTVMFLLALVFPGSANSSPSLHRDIGIHERDAQSVSTAKSTDTVFGTLYERMPNAPHLHRASLDNTTFLKSRRDALIHCMSSAAASRGTALEEHVPDLIIDSAVHVWSTGVEPFPWAVPPPADLATKATPEELLSAASKAGVKGALIVQPINHKYDHSYVTAAIKANPTFFRGMCLANPTLPPSEAIAALEELHSAGFVGVRFNAGTFENGLTSDVGQALYKRAGELGMPVGVMAFKGLGSYVQELRTLCETYPTTTLIIDHLGFFRQPAIGGQLGDAATNDDQSWSGLLSLAEFPQVYVKVSALFRTSAEPPPFLDLQPRVSQLLQRFGASRLMWGSDFPFVLSGGFPLPDGIKKTEDAMSYSEGVNIVSQWSMPELDDTARDALMGGTAAKLFKFGAGSGGVAASSLQSRVGTASALPTTGATVRMLPTLWHGSMSGGFQPAKSSFGTLPPGRCGALGPAGRPRAIRPIDALPHAFGAQSSSNIIGIVSVVISLVLGCGVGYVVTSIRCAPSAADDLPSPAT